MTSLSLRLSSFGLQRDSLKPSKTESLEEVAEGCLKDLFDRNLVLVREWEWNEKIKTCNIHDLLRELCLKIATEKNFFYVLKKLVDAPQVIKERRLVVHGSIAEKKHSTRMFHAMNSAALTRSLTCQGGELSFDYRLLKVVKGVKGVAHKVDDTSLEIEIQHVNLRYLHCKCAHLYSVSQLHSLPSSISMLWNLQTLILTPNGRCVVAPPEFWMMTQIRHVMVEYICLPDPPSTDLRLPLNSLQTLSQVMNFRSSEYIHQRMPNIKKLHLRYTNSSLKECDQEISNFCSYNLGSFKKLESLSCTFRIPKLRHVFLSFTFPISLQKLCLKCCHLHWEDLSIIGSLPYLEVLELHWLSVKGSQWNPVEGEFVRLKSMFIGGCYDLMHWNAESSHFPVLEKLVLESSYKLDEIRLAIGEIPTLQLIHLKNCSVLAAISAAKILVEQESVGNDGLRVEVEFWKEEAREKFKHMVHEEGLKSNNLRANYF